MSVLLTSLPFGLQVLVRPHRGRRLVVLHLDHHLLLHSQSGRLPDGGEDGVSHWECRGPSKADGNRLRDPRSGIYEGVLQGRDIPCPGHLHRRQPIPSLKYPSQRAWDYRQLLKWVYTRDTENRSPKHPPFLYSRTSKLFHWIRPPHIPLSAPGSLRTAECMIYNSLPAPTGTCSLVSYWLGTVVVFCVFFLISENPSLSSPWQPRAPWQPQPIVTQSSIDS